MKKWLRRIRGAIGMGLTGAAAWFGAGMIILLGLLLLTGSTGADVPYPLGFGAFGFVAGVTELVVGGQDNQYLHGGGSDVRKSGIS